MSGGGDRSGAIRGYADAATPALIAQFDDIPVAEIYRHVSDLLPVAPVRMADIGAGTGRDAAWFAAQGHDVLAVEPVTAFREAGQRRHTSTRIAWLDDTLPDLATMPQGARFDLILLCAVWQHLDDPARGRALERLAELVVPGGMVIVSLRHAACAPELASFPIDPDAAIDMAERAGFDLVRRAEAKSVQAESRANGVRWTWLALKRR